MLKLPTFECIRPLHIKLNQSKDAFEQHYKNIDDKLDSIFALFSIIGVPTSVLFSIFIDKHFGIGELSRDLMFISMSFANFFLCAILYASIKSSKFFQKILMKRGQVLKDNMEKARCELYEYLAKSENIAKFIKETQQLKPFLNVKQISQIEENNSWLKKHFLQEHFQSIKNDMNNQNIETTLNSIFFLYEKAVKNSQQVHEQHELDTQFNTMVYGEKSIAIGENYSYDFKTHI